MVSPFAASRLPGCQGLCRRTAARFSLHSPAATLDFAARWGRLPSYVGAGRMRAQVETGNGATLAVV